LAEKAGWDRELLAIELQHLVEIEFDTTIIGFETPEIDIILNEAKDARGEGCHCHRRTARPSAVPVICGSLALIGCYAGTLWKTLFTLASWAAAGPKW
jgi:hypothetical protein